MILHALKDYYNRLEADSTLEENDRIAPYGFSREKISFCVLLGPDGSLLEVQDVRLPDGGKHSARTMTVPDRGGRSGTLIKSNFLWDNSGYALGLDGKGKPERSRRAFEEFRTLHRAMAARVDDPGLRAVCAFLNQWEPERAASLPGWEEIRDKNLVFRVVPGPQQYVHDSPALKDAWLDYVSGEEDSVRGLSLVTGAEEKLARLHPLIKGVRNAQTMGAAIVSFNQESFESYGKAQSYNAPVGMIDAFRYTTVLNRLLSDKHRHVQIGDATVVFWAERPTPFEDELGLLLSDSAAESEQTAMRVRGFLERLRQGRVGDTIGDADVQFYVLGLSPNASRLAVRFWQAGTVREFAGRLAQHVTDIDMAGAREDDPPLTIRRILLATAKRLRDRPDADTIPPLLAGALARAVLTGDVYPQMLFTAVLQRARADGRVEHPRAAILKAYLIRKARRAGRQEDVPVSLNEDHPNSAYHLGRLFAVLEKTQEDAGLSPTMKAHFGSASANPVTALPRLMRLHQHHLEKLKRGKPGLAINRDRLVAAIVAHVDDLPAHLALESQGLFFIGYYHQRQALFTKKDQSTEVAEAAPELSDEAA
jgi:CRISPR-associated protein Csd1